MINYNDVYLYQRFLDILKYEAKIGDVIWYTIVKYPHAKPSFSYTINDKFKELNRARREENLIIQNSNSPLQIPTTLVFNKIIVDETTLNCIIKVYGHDEFGECKRRKLYGY